MSYTDRIRPYVEAELHLAEQAQQAGNASQAFAHLENAHVLGQNSTQLHVRIHWLMLRWSVQQRQWRELLGQLLRIIGAATKTAIGLVPTGNTGGANVSPFKPMPIKPELAEIMERARHAPM